MSVVPLRHRTHREQLEVEVVATCRCWCRRMQNNGIVQQRVL